VRALDGSVVSTPEVVLCSPSTVQVRQGLFAFDDIVAFAELYHTVGQSLSEDPASA
jgi:hypothetical protein